MTGEEIVQISALLPEILGFKNFGENSGVN